MTDLRFARHSKGDGSDSLLEQPRVRQLLERRPREAACLRPYQLDV